MQNKNLLLVVVLVIVSLGGGFFAGMQFQKSQRAPFAGQFEIRGRFGQMGQNVRPVRGQVLSVDATGLTVKLADGSSKIVVVSTSTAFLKSASATKDDVQTGDTVMVVGSQNADGSVTAQEVSINPPAGRKAPAPTK